jgi:hypothetical protein
MTTQTFLGWDSSAWTAVGTVALVLVTAAYVVLTARLSRHAARTAEASERSLLLESMPIVLPNPSGVSNDPGGSRTGVNLANLGRQPALNGSIVAREAGRAVGEKTFSMLAPGGSRSIDLPPQPEGFTWATFSLVVEYGDAVSNRYRLTRDFDGQTDSIRLERYADGSWRLLVGPDLPSGV